jgi:hypothetical protein
MPFSITAAPPERLVVVFGVGIRLTTAGGAGAASGFGGFAGALTAAGLGAFGGASARVAARGAAISAMMRASGVGHSSATTPANVAATMRM